MFCVEEYRKWRGVRQNKRWVQVAWPLTQEQAELRVKMLARCGITARVKPWPQPKVAQA